MLLRGIDFNPVMNAAGAQGFFGEGYPNHRHWKWLGLNFRNCGFVAKTATVDENEGHMPRQADRLTPRDYKPACIKVWPWKNCALNAVGLSGPGIEFLLNDGRWQARSQPFLISLMCIKKDSLDSRLEEARRFVRLLNPRKSEFSSTFGLEINFSCPNVGLNPDHLIGEIDQILQILAALEVPLVVKLNALVEPKAAKRISEIQECDALTMSNSIPWGHLQTHIDWHTLSRNGISPLQHLGGGGLSGAPLLNIVCHWISQARSIGIYKPIIGCGGIMSVAAVEQMINAGATAVQLGTVAILRPWRMTSIIGRAAWLLGPGHHCPLTTSGK